MRIFSSQASNSGSGPQAKDLPKIMAVVKGGGLVAEHDVVRAGHPHDIVAPSHAEQREQGVHVVLIGFGVIGVADIDAHRQARALCRRNDLPARRG